MSLLDVSRLQFAVTVIFHVLFPATTVGLSILLTFCYGAYWRTGSTVYLQLFRFWKRIFAVGFGIGVVAGTVITFELGLNWGRYATATGPILGPIIGMEVVTAFFVEAGFIGVLLYGDGRVRHRTMFIASALVSVGTLLSTTWIIAANSWMQTPAGFALKDGQFVPRDWGQIIFNPSFLWRYPHMLLAVLISAGLFVAGISAWYLIKGRAVAFGRRGLSLGLGVVTVLLPFQLLIGDSVAGDYVAVHQLPKIEAMEGNWDSTNTGYNLFVIPDEAQERNLVQVTVPYIGSLMAKDPTGQSATPGLSLTPREDRPPMGLSFWGFRMMFYGSMVIFAAAMAGLVLRVRGRLSTSTWFPKFLLALTPVGILCIIGGWITAESGRQPWVVYGYLRTEDAVSELAPAQVWASLVAFVLVYVALGVGYVVYIVRQVRLGPERDAVDDGGHTTSGPGPAAPGVLVHDGIEDTLSGEDRS